MDYNEENYEVINDLRLAGIIDKALPGGGLYGLLDNLSAIDTSEHLSLLSFLPSGAVPPRRIETWLRVSGWLRLLPMKTRRIVVAMGRWGGPTKAASVLGLSPPTVSKYYQLGIQTIVDHLALAHPQTNAAGSIK